MSATLPGSSVAANTSGGVLLITATIPITTNTSGPSVFCQPNVDENWAGASWGNNLPVDNIFQFASVSTNTITISRLYTVGAGRHTFTLACATTTRNAVSLPTNGVVSYSVLELH